MADCPSCGSEVRTGSVRCRVCGADLSGDSPWPDRPPTAPPPSWGAGPTWRGSAAEVVAGAGPGGAADGRSAGVSKGLVIGVVAVAAVLAVVAGYLTLVRTTTPAASPRPVVPGGLVPTTTTTTTSTSAPPTTPGTAPDTSFPMPTVAPLPPGATESRGPGLPAAGAPSLQERWRVTLPGGSAASDVEMVGDTVVASTDADVSAYDVRTGTRRWTVGTRGAVAVMVADASGVAVAAEDSVTWYDLRSGANRWQVTGLEPTALAIGADAVFGASAGRIVSFAKRDGAPGLSFLPEGARRAVDVAVEGARLYVSFDLGMGAYDTARGALQWIDQSSCSNESLVAGAGIVSCGQGSGLLGVDGATGEVRYELGYQEGGRLRAGPIAGGRAYGAASAGDVLSVTVASRAVATGKGVRTDGSAPGLAATDARLVVAGDGILVVDPSGWRVLAASDDRDGASWTPAVAAGDGALAASRFTDAGEGELVLFALP